MTAPAPKSETKTPHFAEFVVLIASLMGLGALGIDNILPALPTIGSDLHVGNSNHLQLIISLYFLGLGIGQLFLGFMSDWLGRKRVLLAGVALYVVLSLVAVGVHDFPTLLAIRLLQGCAAATSNVVTRSIIRDLYSGPRMAKVMSLSYMVFLLVPILAPSFGQMILLFFPWQAIFLSMATIGTLAGLWAWLRLPETHPPEARRRPDIGHLKRVAYFVVTEPSSLLYTLAISALIGSLLSYVSLMPQIFHDVFRKPALMAPVFAACAATVGIGSMLNAWLVERLGLKRISYTTLISFSVLSVVHLVWALTVGETILSFMILQSVTMSCMSLTCANFTAIAMEKVGHVAGTAASIQGVATTVGGSILASIIGQYWSGAIYLLPLGALGCGVIALSLVAFAERDRLFVRPVSR